MGLKSNTMHLVTNATCASCFLRAAFSHALRFWRGMLLLWSALVVKERGRWLYHLCCIDVYGWVGWTRINTHSSMTRLAHNGISRLHMQCVHYIILLACACRPGSRGLARPRFPCPTYLDLLGSQFWLGDPEPNHQPKLHTHKKSYVV